MQEEEAKEEVQAKLWSRGRAGGAGSEQRAADGDSKMPIECRAALSVEKGAKRDRKSEK